MKLRRTREPFRPVPLPADWNELVEILKERLNDALKDVVGCKEGGIGGTPRHRVLKVIKASHPSFRLLFDWGVLCGIVPSLAQPGTGQVEISLPLLGMYVSSVAAL